MARRVLIASLAMFLIGLTTSRITVVFHELVGHGAVVEAVGADVVDHTFSLFGGATISYRWHTPLSPAEQLAIDFGGVGIQLILALIALVSARRTPRGSLAEVALLGFAAANAIYAGFYVAAGTYHGFGDFVRMYRWSGSARLPVALGAGLLTVAGGFLAARALGARLRAWMAGTEPRTQALALMIAVAAAAAAHGALTFGERQIAPDRTHQRVMRPMSVRMTERDLARYIRRMRRDTGRVPDAGAIAVKRRQLRQEHRQFPFVWLLGGALGIATLIGVGRSRASANNRDALPRRRGLIALGAVCLASLAVVATLGWLV